LWGELAGNTFQFKSFPLALIMDQAERIAEINARRRRRAGRRRRPNMRRASSPE
jgi:hypothetical protein